MSMGERLKEARIWMGLSLQKAGSKMGVSSERMRQFESYESLTSEQVEQISTALGVNKNWLLTGKGAMFIRETPRMQKASMKAKGARMARKAQELEVLKPVRAAYIRNLREELGVDQKTLAEVIGVAQTSISAYENEVTPISDEMLEQIEVELDTLRKLGQSARNKKSRSAFITVSQAGFLLNKATMEKLGNSGYVKIFYSEKDRLMAIRAAEKGEEGAQSLCMKAHPVRFNNSRMRKIVEKLMGFKIGDNCYRIKGTWTVDEDCEYWKYDMSKAVVSRKSRRK